MCNLEEISQIPKDEFQKILQTWINEQNLAKTFHSKMRHELFENFSKSALWKELELHDQKNSFNARKYVINTIEAEHLYSQKFYFTLSVYATECNSKFDGKFEDNFRFNKTQIQELMELLGLSKEDRVVKQIISKYKATDESLLNITLNQLINCHKNIETKTTGTQTENERDEDEDEALANISHISNRSKLKKRKKKQSCSLANQDHKVTKRPKKRKNEAIIVNSLDKMSQNISIITHKLEEFKKSPSHGDSNLIIKNVGEIMQQLSSCVCNFEHLCDEIKAVNESKNKNYDEWIDDLKNSTNGKRFLKKMSKSFNSILSEEKARIRKDYKRKLENDKRKLAKYYQTAIKSKMKDSPVEKNQLVTDINEIYKSAFRSIENIEKENEIFMKSSENDINLREKTQSEKQTAPKLDLNKCRHIHSAESSSINTNHNSYDSTSFEDDVSDVNI